MKNRWATLDQPDSQEDIFGLSDLFQDRQQINPPSPSEPNHTCTSCPLQPVHTQASSIWSPMSSYMAYLGGIQWTKAPPLYTSAICPVSKQLQLDVDPTSKQQLQLDVDPTSKQRLERCFDVGSMSSRHYVLSGWAQSTIEPAALRTDLGLAQISPSCYSFSPLAPNSKVESADVFLTTDLMPYQSSLSLSKVWAPTQEQGRPIRSTQAFGTEQEKQSKRFPIFASMPERGYVSKPSNVKQEQVISPTENAYQEETKLKPFIISQDTNVSHVPPRANELHPNKIRPCIRTACPPNTDNQSYPPPATQQILPQNTYFNDQQMPNDEYHNNAFNPSWQWNEQRFQHEHFGFNQDPAIIRLRRKPQKICNYCRNNREMKKVYSSHTTHDGKGRVVCPVLRSYTCPICQATGDQAHTLSYCPRGPGLSMAPLYHHSQRKSCGLFHRMSLNKKNKSCT